MNNFPEVIYLHDGQTETTWSESRETFGEKYVRADQVKASPIERHDVEVALDYLATGTGQFMIDAKIAECADKIRNFIIEYSQ